MGLLKFIGMVAVAGAGVYLAAVAVLKFLNFDTETEGLYKFVSPRRLLGVAAALLLVSALVPLIRGAKSLGSQEKHPIILRPSPQGNAILQEIDRRQSQEVLALYEQVSAQLEAAKMKGFDVRELETKAEVALTLNVSEQRRRAVDILQRVQVLIPQGAGPRVSESR
jgi:hypothetical protein